MKNGRNDPCPCGSGKKHKHCCLHKQAPMHSAAELAWRRIRRELEGQPERILRFVVEVYGAEALDEAWAEFMVWDKDSLKFDPLTPHMPIFIPWMMHQWSPDPEITSVADESLHEVAPTRAFLDRKGHQLAPVMREYLESCLRQPFSFYEVQSCVPGRSISLRDVMTDNRFDVREQTASQQAQPHQLIFAQLAVVNGVTMLEATSPVALQPADMVPVIEVRQRMFEDDFDGDSIEPFVSVQMVTDWEIELRELYLELSERRLYASMPTLQTTDGERMELHTLVYDIDSAELAFDALKHLGDESDQLGVHAERDAAGNLERIRIHWLAPDEGEDSSRTMLGFIRIDGTRMRCEVSSEERADRLKLIIAELLGNHATFRVDSIEQMESALDRGSAPPTAPTPEPIDPMTQDMITAYMHKHYQQWVDDRLPVLSNRTPREMMTSADGREQVAALVHGAEQHDMGLPPAAHKEVFDAVRKTLGLLP